ncbi:MAG: MFS transporter [Actinobacteria bacterium]|nr:MFS transporter [Actinomycetota bacterium]MCL5025158.1 MFS transporter [Chloroflexota bacterium]
MIEKDNIPDADLRKTLLYGAASFGSGLFFGFSAALLPLFLSRYTSSSLVIGIVSSLRPIAALAAQPLVGAWSDRLRTPLGRRHVFLWAGVPLCAVLVAATPLATNLLMVALGIGLFGLFFSVAYGPYQTLLADVFPPHRRGSVNAVASLLSLLGQAGIAGAGSLLAGVRLDVVFYIVAGGLLISFGATALGLEEPPPSTDGQSISLKQQLDAALARRTALQFLASQWLLWFGINAVAPFITLFLVSVYGATEMQALLGFLLLVLASGAFALPAGRLGDRLGKKPVLATGLVLFIISSLGVLAVRQYETAAALLLIAGAANAIVNVLSYPLLTELVPADEVGTFTGLNLGLQSAGVPLAILFAGALIGAFGYPSIFLLLAATSAGSLALLQTLPGRGVTGERPQSI